MAQVYAAISDGTTTVTFADGAGGSTWYKIESDWTPNVAPINRSLLSGRGLYEDVQETIPIAVGGSNAAHAYANLNTLNNLLERGSRWYDGKSPTPVLFRYSPAHAVVSSSGSPLNAPIWDGRLTLPPNVNPITSASVAQTWITGITMSFMRRGSWHLHKPTIFSGTTERISHGPTASNMAVVNMSFTGTAPGARYPLCYALEVNDTLDRVNGYIVLTRYLPTKTNIYMRDASNFSTPMPPYSLFNDAANLPRHGTHVLRYTPSTATWVELPGTTSTIQGIHQAYVIISCRNNSSTTDFLIRMRFAPSIGNEIISGATLLPRNQSPKPVFLSIGPVSLQPSAQYLVALQIRASAAVGSCDINAIAIIEANDPGTQIIGVNPFYYRITLRHAEINDNLTPRAITYNTDDLSSEPENALMAVTVYGSPSIYGIGNDMSVLPMISGPTRWAQSKVDGSLGTVRQYLTRRLTYLTPQ